MSMKRMVIIVFFVMLIVVGPLCAFGSEAYFNFSKINSYQSLVKNVGGSEAKSGDIIEISPKFAAYVCDFSKTIFVYTYGGETMNCVYIGEVRERK